MAQWLPSTFGYDLTATPGCHPAFIGSVLQHAVLPGRAADHHDRRLELTMRNNMITTLAEDYVRMARAKGLTSAGSCWTTPRATRSCRT